MYVFIDADLKDATPENIDEVKYMASEEYGVTVNFFTTGNYLGASHYLSPGVHFGRD